MCVNGKMIHVKLFQESGGGENGEGGKFKYAIFDTL
jgi:hypothetical protein